MPGGFGAAWPGLAGRWRGDSGLGVELEGGRLGVSVGSVSTSICVQAGMCAVNLTLGDVAGR